MFTICVFICNDPATTEIYSYRHTLSLHDALPICWASQALQPRAAVQGNLDPVFLVTGGEPMIRAADAIVDRSEEQTSELQSLMRISYAVFCLKKKKRDLRQHT